MRFKTQKTNPTRKFFQAHLVPLTVSFVLILTVLSQLPLLAAVGCDLNDPSRDIKFLFPESTGFRTFYVSVKDSGGQPLLEKIEQELGDRFTGLYETLDVPYTVYEIYRDEQIIGYVHGVNQKGRYGGVQVFLALTPGGKIIAFYLQKFTGKGGRQFRSPEFAAQFQGLELKDFENYQVQTGSENPQGAISRIKNPVPEAADDFKAILRAVKKNLILMKFLVFTRHQSPQVGTEAAASDSGPAWE